MKLTRLACVALAVSLPACSTLQDWQATPGVQFAEAEAMKLGVQFLSNGGNTDNMWSISNGLNLLGDVATFAAQQRTGAPNLAAAITVKQQVRAFADNPIAVRPLASGLADALQKLAPQTAAQRAAIVLALASGIQNAAVNESQP